MINYDSTVGEGFVPGCYVSLRMSSVFNNKEFISAAYPKTYNHFIDITGLSKESDTPYLFWFRGTLHSHPIRKDMFEELQHSNRGLMIDVTKAFHTHNEHEKNAYVSEMQSCKFVLCPRGTSPNSYRLFEAMSAGKCPVIISDDWVETEGPDWKRCSIRISEDEIGSIEKILTERENDAHQLGMEARKEWEKYFSVIAKNTMYLTKIIQLDKSIPSEFRTMQSYKARWSSSKFYRNNEWAIEQRLLRGIKKILTLSRLN